MKKIWKKRVSLVMAMLLVMNVIFAYPVTAHAEESLPGDQDGFTVHSFEVNLVDGDTKTPITDESEVVAGDEVEVKFEWTLENSVRIPEEDVETWTSAEFTIDTNDAQFKYSGINIPGMKVGEETAPLPLYATGAGTEVGSYYMKDGIIHIIITDKTFFQHEDNRYGGVSFSGTIANNGDKTEDGEPKEISFGTHSSNPNYYLENTESSARVNKATSGELVKNGDKFYQTFTVTITADNGTVTNIDLTDSVSPADMLSNPTDVQITASTATGLATGSYASLDEAFAAIKANTFYKDESITLQYTMEVDASVYEQNAEWYKNIVSGTYESNRSEDPKNVSAEAGVYVEKPYVNKAGVSFERRDGKGYVTWKITINLGDYYTGSSNDLADYLKSITDLPGAGLTQDGESLPLNPDYFVQDSNNPAIYTYVYETEVEEAIANSTSDETVKNKVTVTTQDDNIYTGNEAGYTIPGIGPSVEKTILSKVRDNEGLHVTWNIRVADIPKSGITALTVNDDSRHYNNNPGNQNLLYEIYIDDVLVADANGIIDTDKIKAVNNWDSGQYGSIILQDAYVNDVANADGEINIQVKTLITEDTIGKEYGNMANVSYKDTTTGSSTTTPDSRATFQDATNLLTKTGAVVAGEDCIDYTVKVSLPPLELTEAGKHFIIDDILPVGMQLKADSASVRLTDQWGNEKHVFACTPTTSNVTVDTETAIKISFDVETADEWISKLVGYNGATSGGYYLVVTYRAELTDRAGFIQDGVTKEFTNSVSGTYDGETIGSDKATNSMNPSQIVYKTAEYTSGTAPFIKYTVDVNPDAVTLLDGTAKLQAVDEIGSALKFVDADYFDNAEKKTKYRVQVLDIETSNELILGSDYTYTMAKNRRSISFELPDSKALRIIYWAYAEPGTTLTAENSTNSFSLSGMSSDVAGDEYSFDMVAYTPNGWTGSEVGSIILYKFWTDEGEQVALEGSVFRLERVQYDEETGTFVPKEVNGSSIILDNITVSDENRYDTGKIIIENLPVNQVMALYEISSPDGFAINRKPYYFVLEGSTAVTLPDEYNVTIYQSGSTMDYENHEAAVLVLEKTVEGDVEQADIEGVITFTVTDENGILIGTYQPGEGDFTYADGKWKLTLEDLEPGVYTVEETVYNATGHVARKVLYSIDAGSWSAGEKDTEAEVTLEENTTTTVTFKNIYDGFDVLVSKTMLTGGATLAGARLQITGTQADGTQITPIEWTSSVSAYCVKLYPGSYVLEELEAPTGYKKAASVAFTVDEDGTLTVDSQTVDGIEMQDEEISAELIKVDAADNNAVLEGATIGLYDEEDVNNDGSLKDDATALVSWTTSATPYDFGSYLTCGKNYYLVETVAPNGYELAAPIAISVSAAGEVSVTSNDITVTDGVIYMEDTAVAGDFGSLVLTKTIAGEWNNPDLDGKVTFKVESIDVVPAFSETYTLGEGSFLWDDVAGKYILTLNNLPVGTYKVTETLGSSTPENMSCTVTYTVNAGASENGTETGNVSVNKDAETAVAYTNTYAILKGSIQVSKSFTEATGTLTWDDIKNNISFTIKDSTGTEITGSPISGADLTLDNGKYVSDEIEVEVGTYTVEETLTTIDGYTVTTAYTVTTDGVEGADGNTTATGDIEVGDGESVVVAFVNTYTAEENLGALKLTKAVAGALDRSELEGELQFKVENADGNTPAFDETYTLGEGDFTWNAVSGTYELLIEDLPVGNYKVTEIQGTTTPENMSCTVTYTVNAGATQTGTVTGAVEVTEDETSTVAYTNTYAILKGSIQVSKSFTEATGTLTWDDIKNNISFTIKDSTGTEIAGSPISGADLTLDNGKYVSDEIEVEVGTYTVEETVTAITGYTVTTTYSISTDGNQGTSGDTTTTGNITVGDEESVAVDFVNTYVKQQLPAELGALKLTKAVAGALDRSELEGELQFRVENADDTTPVFNETYTLGEGAFTWNAVSGTYELLIEDLPVGNYKVTEIQGTTTPENMSCTVTYIVNAGATQTGTVTGAVEVTEDETSTVAYTNTYAILKGSIQVSKNFNEATGTLTWDDIKNNISFTIKDSNGAEIAGSPISGADLTLSGGKYVSDEIEVEVGTYTVEETLTTIEGYNVTTTYTITNDGTAGANGNTTATEEIEVEDGKTVVVDYINTYAVHTGTIQLSKSFSEATGTLTWDDIKNNISFTIKDSNGAEIAGSPVSGADLTLSGGKYVSDEIEVEIGTYTVEETVTDITGYTVTTTYSISTNGNQGTSGDTTTTGNITVGNGDAVVVAYTNTYTVITGTIQVSKSFAEASNTLTWDDIKNNISFTIKDANGVEIAGSPVSGADLTLSGGKYVSDEIEVAIGTYTVEETVTDITGYTVTTTYSISTDGNQGTSGDATTTGNITVEDGEAVVVDFVNTYVKQQLPAELGALKITKAVAGDLDRSELEGELQFRVENADDTTPVFNETYTLGEGGFTWNAVAGTYELLIEDLPVGNYKVTEIQGTTTPENMSCTVTYTVNAGETKTGTVTGAVEIVKDETSTVAYTNTYAILKGKIQVSKTFTEASNTLTWDDIKGNISFTIKDSTGTEITGSPISGASLTLNGGKYVSDEIEVEVGTYTVEETLTTIEGYTVTTTYTIITDGAAGTSVEATSTSATSVEGNQTVEFAFSNTYTKNVVEQGTGTLIITKTLKGEVDRAKAEKSITFKVTNNATSKSTTYKLSEFDYDEATGEYTLELECTEGGYTVEESVTSVSGYSLTKVTYTVDGTTTGGKKTTITIAEDETETVAFEDTYKKKTSKKTDDDDDDDDDEVVPTPQPQTPPKTGDETPLGLLFALFGCGFMGILAGCAALIRKKKQE